MSKSKAETQKVVPDASQLLTADEIFAGGDDLLSPLEIPELKKGGKPGIVYLKQLSTGDVLDFAESGEQDQKSRMLTLIAKAVVNQDGSPMFSEDQVTRLRDIRVDVFTRLSRAITDSMSTIMAEDTDKGKVDERGTGDLPIV